MNIQPCWQRHGLFIYPVRGSPLPRHDLTLRLPPSFVNLLLLRWPSSSRQSEGRERNTNATEQGGWNLHRNPPEQTKRQSWCSNLLAHTLILFFMLASLWCRKFQVLMSGFSCMKKKKKRENVKIEDCLDTTFPHGSLAVSNRVYLWCCELFMFILLRYYFL